MTRQRKLARLRLVEQTCLALITGTAGLMLMIVLLDYMTGRQLFVILPLVFGCICLWTLSVPVYVSCLIARIMERN